MTHKIITRVKSWKKIRTSAKVSLKEIRCPSFSVSTSTPSQSKSRAAGRGEAEARITALNLRLLAALLRFVKEREDREGRNVETPFLVLLLASSWDWDRKGVSEALIEGTGEEIRAFGRSPGDAIVFQWEKFVTPFCLINGAPSYDPIHEPGYQLATTQLHKRVRVF